MDLHAFIQEYTDAVYHRRNPDAADRFVADPCTRHEHGQRVVMSLAENKARIAEFLTHAGAVWFEFAVAVAEGELYAGAYQFSVVDDGRTVTRSGIEIFRVRDEKIVETWNSIAGEGPWG